MGIGLAVAIGSDMFAPLPELEIESNHARRWEHITKISQPNCNITMFSLARGQVLGKPLTKSVCALGITHLLAVWTR